MHSGRLSLLIVNHLKATELVSDIGRFVRSAADFADQMLAQQLSHFEHL
jgi:hypothetical protein